MVTRKPIPPPEPGCTQLFECLLSDPLALVLLIAGTGLFLAVLAAALAHIAGARSLLAEERRRVAAEAEAFDAFARRVADMEATPTPAPSGAPGATTALETASPGTALQQVRDAYRDTVMAVPHYEAEYGESLATNMAVEFGEDVANAVADETWLTPPLKGTLVERSRTASSQRVTLLGQLEEEAEVLDDAEAELGKTRRSVDRLADAPIEEYSFDALAAEWHLLRDRERECEAVLVERQEAVQARNRETRGRSNAPCFEEYLYGALDVTYPVLAEGTALLERLRRTRRRVEDALAARG